MSIYKDINTGKEYNRIPNGKIQPIFVKGLPVTELAYDKYYYSNPINLDEVIVLPLPSINPHETEQNLKHRNKVSKADARTAETSAFEKPLNFLSPSLHFGAFIDYLQGENSYLKGVYDGNSGWVPDNFAYRYPRATALINMGTDMVLTHGATLFYKWGTTPRLIGQGASKRAYSAPFWRNVYTIGGDPEYIQLQGKFTRAVKSLFLGYNSDGEAIHSSPKVRKVSKPSKGFIKALIKDQFFPTEVIGDTETVYISPANNKVALDLEYVKPLFGFKTQVLDPELLSIEDYTSILKRGGKLNGRT